jgi:hypothetical protein
MANRDAISNVERSHWWKLDKGDNTRLDMAIYLRLVMMENDEK